MNFNITPNFSAIFAQFSKEAKAQADGISRRLNPAASESLESWQAQKLDTLRAIQALIVPVTMMAQSVQSNEDFLILRDRLAYTLEQINRQANELEATIARAKAEEEQRVFRTSDGHTLYLVDGEWVDSLDPEKVDLTFDNEDGWPSDSNGESLDGNYIERGAK
jgi:hypothetical protein